MSGLSGYAQKLPATPKLSDVKLPALKRPLLSGKTSLDWQSSNQPNNGQQMTPPNYLRWGFHNTIDVAGLPIAVDAFLTTENSPFRQNMNYFRVSLDQERLRQNFNEGLQKRIKAAEEDLDRTRDSLANPRYYRQKAERASKDKGAVWRDSLDKSGRKTFAGRLDSLKTGQKKRDRLKKKVDRLEKLEQKSDTMSAGKKAKLEKLRAGLDSTERNVRKAEASLDKSIKKYTQNRDTLKQAAEVYGKRLDAKLADQKKQITPPEERKRKGEEMLAAKQKQLDDLQQLADQSPKNQAQDSLKTSSRLQKILMRFERFNIGVSTPYYSEFSLNGAQITGVDAAYSGPKLYVAATGAHNLRPTQPPRTVGPAPGTVALQSSYARNLVAFAVGYGRKDTSHLHFHTLYGIDKADSSHTDTSAFGRNNPTENLVLGMNFRYAFPRKFAPVQVEGELNRAFLINDVRKYRLDGNAAPEVFRPDAYANARNDADLAWRAGVRWQPDTLTTVQGQIRQVGPGYHSMGLVFYRNDYRSALATIDRFFLKKRLQATLRGMSDATNIYGWKPVGVQTVGGGATLALRLQHWPEIIMSYDHLLRNQTPFNPGDTATVSGYTQMASAAVTQGFELVGMNCRLLINSAFQNTAAKNPLLNAIASQSQATLTVEAARPITAALSARYLYQQVSFRTVRILGAQATVAAKVLKVWTHAVTYGLDKNLEQGVKHIASYETSYALTRFLTARTKGELLHYVLAGNAFNISTFQAGMVLTW